MLSKKCSRLSSNVYAGIAIPLICKILRFCQSTNCSSINITGDHFSMTPGALEVAFNATSGIGCSSITVYSVEALQVGVAYGAFISRLYN